MLWHMWHVTPIIINLVINWHLIGEMAYYKIESWLNTKHMLYSSSSLQVIFDILGVIPVKALQLLIELHIPLIDVVDVGVLAEHPPSGELIPLVHLLVDILGHSADGLFPVLVTAVDQRSSCSDWWNVFI